MTRKETYNSMKKEIIDELLDFAFDMHRMHEIGDEILTSMALEPSLILLMKVRTVKRDITDSTLSVRLYVLPGLNADFDGDILNLIGLMMDELVHAFRKFDPVSRMIISRDTGFLNDYFAITKGQLIDLYNFCTMD